MTAAMRGYNPHEKPPESMKQLFKYWRKSSRSDLDKTPFSVDIRPQHQQDTTASLARNDQLSEDWRDALSAFCGSESFAVLPDLDAGQDHAAAAVELSSLQGLCVFRSLMTQRAQINLLEKLIHRDLVNSIHKTNIDLHYNVHDETQGDDPESKESTQHSFFAKPDDSLILPKDPAVHKTMTIRQMLETKLRWVTLGGQYDWTNKVYPAEVPPEFPPDIACLMNALFPSVVPQAAILNFYSPGDTLSVHRDVSEECANSLISVSIGCDAIFIAGTEDGSRTETIRLRSGDVLLMSGESRYAWHAVPKIIPGTCPTWLSDWPGGAHSGEYQNWTGWMQNKRINLNVRQMTGHRA